MATEKEELERKYQDLEEKVTLSANRASISDDELAEIRQELEGTKVNQKHVLLLLHHQGSM